VPVALALTLALALTGEVPATPTDAPTDSPTPEAIAAPATTPPAAADPVVFFVELPLALSAHGTTSKVETVLSSWLGVRGGMLSSSKGGLFTGFDVGLLLGGESGGTGAVNVTRTPILVEGRGLVGGRFRGGFVGVGGYGYGGVGLGGGVTSITAFDDNRLRPFATAALRVGGGTEVSFGPAMLRIEMGTGARDLRLELHGAVSLGARF
jgi:hypothetical protein